MRKILLFSLLAALSTSAFADVVYYVDLTNATSRITSFEVAARGSDRFHPMLIDSRTLEGSGGAVTVVFRRGSGDCLRDLRIGFADGRRIVRRDFDVCRLPSYRIGQDLLLATQP
jgi:hypothetical protein